MRQFSLLCVLLIFFIPATGFTSYEDPIIFLEDISIEEDITEEFAEQNGDTYQKGLTHNKDVWRVDEGWETLYSTLEFSTLELPPPEENINLYVPKYYQNQQPWSNDIMQTKGYKIGTHGCALTSFAMVTNYYGSNHNPGKVNTVLGNAACSLNWITAKSKYNLEYDVKSNQNGIDESVAKTWIRDALRQNRPVIVCLKNPINNGTHFVVVEWYARVRYHEDLPPVELFLIHDPSAHINYRYLDDYLHHPSSPRTIINMKSWY